MNAADELQADIKSLTKEVEYLMDKCHSLEDIVDAQHSVIKEYHKIAMLQDAEIKKLRDGEHD